jgi:asparagine synthase (glutamine-hydrolysing)
MPGIVGLITKRPRKWAEPQLLRMAESIRHEFFYVTGTWMDESLGVYVGWSARKSSFSDETPLHNERGDAVLVFSGEEYPEPGTACRLKGRGHAVEPNGPGYLVHLYEEQDSTFPAVLNGQFHGLLSDRTRGTAILFNDRYGMHRIYYHRSEEAFYFAAEAKAILAVRPELRRINQRSLGEFVACGCVLENRTLFEGVQVLPAASAWVFRNGALEQERAYFQPQEWENQPSLDRESYYRELKGVFTRNLPRYFNGRERVGMSLTGGLDTRMIMAWHKPAPGSLPCYTFGGMIRDCQDAVVARKVAKLCGQSHVIIRVGDEFLSRFPSYAERTVYLTDACVDVSCSPVLYANERAAEIAPVRMTGNYGGEILRRLLAFKPWIPRSDVFRPEFVSQLNAAKATYARLLKGHGLSFVAFRQVPWHHWGLRALEQAQLAPRSPYLDNDLVRTAFRAPDCSIVTSSIFEDNDECTRLIAEGSPALRELRTDRALGSPRNLSTAILRRYLEFTFKAEYAYDYGMPQWVAQVDHLFSAFHFERLFLGRHKYYHFRVWYRDKLSEYVREMLLDSRTLSRPYLEPARVKALVRSHLKGDRNYTTEIHKLLTLELIDRLFIDAN